jgi:hypothetical protein
LQENDFPENRKGQEQAEYDFTLRFPVRQGNAGCQKRLRPTKDHREEIRK